VPSKLYGVLQTRAQVLFIGPRESGTAMGILARGAGECLEPGCDGRLVAEALDRLAGRHREPLGGSARVEERAIAACVTE
jgi:hypothetical protein